jgi:hypothetical protein
MAGITRKDDDDDKVHRLTDIVVEEVSIVDRPANLQPFLVVKRAEPMKGTEIQLNDDGELVTSVTKDDDEIIDDEKDKDDDKTSASKSGAKMSRERMEQLSIAIDALSALKESLVPDPGPSAGSAQARKNDDDDGGATKLLDEIAKRMEPITKAIGKLHEVVNSQERRIRKQADKSSKRDEIQTSSRADVEKGRRSKEPSVAWPLDMNREETPGNTPKHRSFFDD